MVSYALASLILQITVWERYCYYDFMEELVHSKIFILSALQWSRLWRKTKQNKTKQNSE